MCPTVQATKWLTILDHNDNTYSVFCIETLRTDKTIKSLYAHRLGEEHLETITAFFAIGLFCTTIHWHTINMIHVLSTYM